MVIPDGSARTSVLLQARLDLTLESVTEEWHWYENRQNALLMFWLHFPGIPVLAVRGSGEMLRLAESEPHSSYDMREYGQSKVGPGRQPSLLAAFVGSRLRDATLIWGYSTEPAVGGVLFQFDTGNLAVASFCDEWVIARDGLPPDAARYHRVEAVTITGCQTS